MRAVKASFVCGQEHLSRQRHIKNEVTAAIEKSKAEHKTALPTVQDLSSLYAMVDEKEGEDADKHADWVQWPEES